MKDLEPLNRFFIEQQPSEEQVGFEWSRIKARLGSKPASGGRFPKGMMVFASVSTALVLATTVLYLKGRIGPAPSASTAMIQGPGAMTLADGSLVTVATGGRVGVVRQGPDSIRIDLKAGEATFDVTHRVGRSFTVMAAGVEVRVIGTQFRVGIEASQKGETSRVRVSVSRGAVEVAQMTVSTPAVRVGAGEERLFGPSAAEPVPAAPVAAKVEDASPAVAIPHQLFQQANLARRAGHIEEAARLYDQLLSRFPNNQRAGLAALELGRLRMDLLGDLAGAADAFRDAASRIPSGSLHEDAEARLVDALDGLHDWTGCRRARQEYLSSYKHGVHAMAVSARCGAR